ncbi:hypothetical protein MSAN_00774300 [Mycena sanguinolenta]|uniref:Uncharacterized protein n=1 Tax=Mycena sanguinolenta TaxID=230812 RepID=A0A8H6Z326_9AGAR|nr:hypothetical protein MSAN_00774300 [Mycena sanguinolenta]
MEGVVARRQKLNVCSAYFGSQRVVDALDISDQTRDRVFVSACPPLALRFASQSGSLIFAQTQNLNHAALGLLDSFRLCRIFQSMPSRSRRCATKPPRSSTLARISRHGILALRARSGELRSSSAELSA